MTRKFSSISVQTTLATGISNTALTVPVAVGTGSTLMGGVSLAGGNVDQYSILIDPNLSTAEIMWVTGVSGDNLTVLRGKDGTSAVAHNAGAVIQHILTAGDLTYLVGAAAPTSDLANTGLPFPGSTSGTTTLKATAIAGTNILTLPATSNDTLIGKATTDVLTNKDITSPTNTFPELVAAPTHAATSKTTPVDTDEMPIADSAATFGIKKLTWANLKATLKTYFDTLYASAATYISNSLLSSTGDIIYASSANTPARRAVGATGNVLTVAGGVPTWAAPTPVTFNTNYNYVVTQESTTSTSYTGLTTPGAVTVTTGTKALVTIKTAAYVANSNESPHMSYAVSGATTIVANDEQSISFQFATGNSNTYLVESGAAFLVTGLTAGSNTFTTQFKSTNGNTCNFLRRSISVINLGS